MFSRAFTVVGQKTNNGRKDRFKSSEIMVLERFYNDFINNKIEVEDIINLLFRNDIYPDDINNLRNKLLDRQNEEGVLLFVEWIEVVYVFSKDKYLGIKSLILKREKLSFLAVSLLEEIKTSETIGLVSECLDELGKYQNEIDFELVGRLLSVVNMVLSFPNNLVVSPEQKAKLREQIYGYVNMCDLLNLNNESLLVNAYCALRGVGNTDSVSFIKNRKPLINPENVGIEKIVTKVIKKALG